MAASIAKQSLLLRLMSTSVAIANQAGKIIREILRKGDLGIVDKGINDLQTEADRSVQRCIVNTLSRQFPKIKVIGEESLEKQDNDDDYIINLSNCDVLNVKCPEGYLTLSEEDVVVWVDPLDGTREYTQGLLDHVTVLIGIAVQGKAIAGVVHQPYYNYQPDIHSENSDPQIENDYMKLGRTMWGIVGAGAHGIEAKCAPEGKRIITTTRSHSNPLIEKTISSLNADEVLKVGGAGHKVLMVIEGKAHAYVFPSKGCKKWDTCAPEALLTSAGGKLTDIHGNPIQYHADVEHANATGVLATYNSSVHDWYTSHIPKEIKDELMSSKY